MLVLSAPLWWERHFAESWIMIVALNAANSRKNPEIWRKLDGGVPVNLTSI
jgi:hypothetical protein